MQFGVMITNYGKHSDEKMAAATAEQIIQVGANAVGEQADEARSLNNKIMDILTKHHGKVSHHEISNLEKGPEHLSTFIDPREHSEDTVAEIMAACDASPFADWFSQEHVRQNVMDTVHTWTATNMHMHRGWYCDGKIGHHKALRDHEHDLDNEHVRKWVYAKHHGAPGTGYGGLPPAIVEQAKLEMTGA